MCITYIWKTFNAYAMHSHGALERSERSPPGQFVRALPHAEFCWLCAARHFDEHAGGNAVRCNTRCERSHHRADLGERQHHTSKYVLHSRVLESGENHVARKLH